MSKPQHYLLFDSSCSLCTDLAAEIERASGGALRAESLYARQAKVWLDQARPGWKFEPTLIEVNGNQVHAYTGMAMRARMLTFLNPLQLLKIARLVQQAGVPLFGAFEAREPGDSEAAATAVRDEIASVQAESSSTARAGTRAASPEKENALPSGFRLTHEGPEVGTESPVTNLTTMTGAELSLTQGTRDTILLFMSTTCPFCQQVAQALPAFAGGAPEQLVLVFSQVKPEALQAFVREYHLQDLPAVLSPETRSAFQVIGVPYAFALDAKGIVRGKGIVNDGAQLESLASTLYISAAAFRQALAHRNEDRVEVI